MITDRFSTGWFALALAVAVSGCTTSSSDAGGASGSGGSGGSTASPKDPSGSDVTAGKAGGSANAGSGGAGSGSAGSSGMASGGAGTGSLVPKPEWDWHDYVDDNPATLGTAERGEYLVDHVLVCGVCHTPSLPDGTPDTTLYLAGSRPYDFIDIDGTVITVNAENLTAHDPEGLHTWTDGQIRVAITRGADDEHYAIYPIMPYPEYSMLKPEDVDSIIKYLRTVPANDNVVASDYPRPDIHAPAAPVNEPKVPHTTLKSSDPEYASAERGRYLASVACLNCHTEEVVLPNGMTDHDNPNLERAFAGGKQYTFEHMQGMNTSANITPDETGIAGWSVEDIVAAIKEGKEKGTGRKLCNTHPSTPDRYSKMTDEDAKDIATYIHSLPPIKNGPFKCTD